MGSDLSAGSYLGWLLEASAATASIALIRDRISDLLDESTAKISAASLGTVKSSSKVLPPGLNLCVTSLTNALYAES